MDIFPTIIMIFGGAGDLTWRKLMPSLFDLHREGRMPDKFAIIAVDRVPMRDAELHWHFFDPKAMVGSQHSLSRLTLRRLSTARHLSGFDVRFWLRRVVVRGLAR